MAMIMNSLDRENQVTIGGNTFTFKPRQIKHFYQENVAKMIVRVKADYGFIDMPAEFEDLEYGKTEEGKAIIESKRKDGVENYCKFLRGLVYNAQVSLKKDLDMANIKADPRSFASDGDLHNMEELARYQAQKSDADQRRIDKIKALEAQVGEQTRNKTA